MNSYSEFETFLSSLKRKPRLLLHSCCGPCSTSVLELLSKYFIVDVYYYNPNIYPFDEYVKRKNEQERLIKELPFSCGFIEGDYDDLSFYKSVSGLENEKEGGLRCKKCISLRLEKTFMYAKEYDYDYVTTTLSVSPHKNSKMINEIGYSLEKKYQVPYLYSDFKKKDGYKRSILLSKKYNLYRQTYCGCKYSSNNFIKNLNTELN